MKIVIEIDTEKELVTPHLASALGALLEQHVSDTPDNVSEFPPAKVNLDNLKAGFVPPESNLDLEKPEKQAESSTEQTSEYTKDAEESSGTEKATIDFEEIKTLGNKVVKILGGTGPFLDTVATITGERKVSKSDDTHYAELKDLFEAIIAENE